MSCWLDGIALSFCKRLPRNILEAFPHNVAIAPESTETSCTLAPRETKGQMRYTALSKMHTRTNYSTTSSASCGRLVGWLKVQRYTGWTVPATLLASAGGWCSCTCPIRGLISEYQICAFCYSVPDRGAEYCDDRVCLSVCLVCRSASISLELRIQSSPNYLYILPVALVA